MTFGYTNPYATPQQGYTLQNGTMVKPATATSGPMTGTYGGEGMSMPEGATAAGGSAGGANFMNGATFALNGLADAGSAYAQADSLKHKFVTPMSMKLADYPVYQIQGQRTPTA